MDLPEFIQTDVSLAPLTSLGLGGPAEFFVRATTEAMIFEALAWARRQGVPVTVLGGGSNVVIADEGVHGLVIHTALTGRKTSRLGHTISVTAAAGEDWREFVQYVVHQNWAGVECLAGIPGLVGASPIQNIGAYGQEVSATIQVVRAIERQTGKVCDFGPSQCQFDYRNSLFKRFPDEYLVVSVTYALTENGMPQVAYQELAQALPDQSQPTLQQVAQTVLRLRQSKDMLLPSAAGCGSVGSFFLNPIVTADALEKLKGKVKRKLPAYQVAEGQYKVPAAWLIEEAGFKKGDRHGAVGLSQKHALAVVHYGGGSTMELIAFARRVRDGVKQRLGVELIPEPRVIGTAF